MLGSKGLVTLTLLMPLILPTAIAVAKQSRRFSILPNSDTIAPVSVTLPIINAGAGQTISIPITTGDVTGRGAISFNFEIRFDPAILRLVVAAPTTNAQPISSGFTIAAVPNLSSRILVSGFSAYPFVVRCSSVNPNRLRPERFLQPTLWSRFFERLKSFV